MSTINPTPEIRKSHRQINFFKTGSICIIQHDGISRQADGWSLVMHREIFPLTALLCFECGRQVPCRSQGWQVFVCIGHALLTPGRQLYKGWGFCSRYLIQTCFTHTPEPVIIIRFCEIVLYAPGVNIHARRTVLTGTNLFCPLPDPDLLRYKTGLRSYTIPPLIIVSLKSWVLNFLDYVNLVSMIMA